MPRRFSNAPGKHAGGHLDRGRPLNNGRAAVPEVLGNEVQAVEIQRGADSERNPEPVDVQIFKQLAEQEDDAPVRHNVAEC